jgi:integrase
MPEQARTDAATIHNTHRQVVQGVYYVHDHETGKRRRIFRNLGTFAELGLNAAGKARRKRDAPAIARRIDRLWLEMQREVEVTHRTEPEDAATGHTLGDLRDWYLRQSDVASYASLPQIRMRLNTLLDLLKADKAVAGLTPADLQAYKAKRSAQESPRLEAPGRRAQVSPTTINRELEVLQAMLNFAVQAGEIPVNPVARAPKLRINNSRARICSPDEELALYVHASHDTLRDIIILARYTGMRESEILGLSWDEVDIQRQVIRLPAHRTKEAAPKVIPLVIRPRGAPETITHAFDAVQRQPRIPGQPRIFCRPHPKTGEPTPLNSITTIWLTTRKRAGCPDLWFHDLRRTFAVWMTMALGFPERTVMAITGHRTRTAWDRYRADRETEALSVMDDRTTPRDPVAEYFAGLGNVVSIRGTKQK